MLQLDENARAYCQAMQDISRVQPASVVSTDMYEPVLVPEWCPEEFKTDNAVPPHPPLPWENQLGWSLTEIRRQRWEEMRRAETTPCSLASASAPTVPLLTFPL